jgi:serine/threonine protein kinase
MIGKTLGHYRVVQELGRGGMGEVYLADDISLDRKVALKFLPDAFTGDHERMARFEREAKLLASLNHPNIAAIYGLEQAEGKRFIVMELVEGETLAQRISKGSLPVEEALGLCRQIAEGLEAAHEKGVIHRDLKPANVMITEGDKVKILDFGLAKALADETQRVNSSQSPTLTEAMTRPGVILGTAAYMSPEQAKGKTVDKRADIWAFGCILYECLTGKRVFEGETVTETLAAILTRETEWERVAAKVRPLLRRCLERDPKKRLRDIGEAMAWIESAPESAPAKRPWLAWIWAATATLLFRRRTRNGRFPSTEVRNRDGDGTERNSTILHWMGK